MCQIMICGLRCGIRCNQSTRTLSMFCVSNDALRGSLWDSLRTSLRDSLEFSLRDSLWESMRESIGWSLQSVYKGVEYVLCV